MERSHNITRVMKGLPPDPDPPCPSWPLSPVSPCSPALLLAYTLAHSLLGSCLPPNVSFFVSPFLLLNALPSAP